MENKKQCTNCLMGKVCRNCSLETFNCKSCRKVLSAVKNHLDTFYRGNKMNLLSLIECTLCKTRFDSEKELNAHKATSHVLSRPVHRCPFQCKYCSKSYEHVKEIKYLRNHLMEFHRGTPEAKAAAFNEKYIQDRTAVRKLDAKANRPCFECGKDLEDEVSGFYHQIFDHYNQKSCSVCNEEFSCSTELKNHSKKLGHKLNFCTMCQKRCRNSSELLKHMENAHSQSVTYPFICECCGKCFRSLSNLTVHYQRHYIEASPPTPHTCSNCHKNFSTSLYLKIHMENKICQSQSYRQQPPISNEKVMCNICRKLLFRSNLDRHNANSHQIVDKAPAYKCQECNFSSDSSSGLSVHRRTHFEYVNSQHVKMVYYKEDEKKVFRHFKCNLCKDAKVFYKRNDISLHVYTQHAIILPGFKAPQGKQVKCKRCNKIVFQKEFRKHMARHAQDSRILTFQCHLCHKELSGVREMRKHFMTIHSGSEQADRSAKNERRYQEDIKTSEMQRSCTQTDIFCVYCKLTFSSIFESDYHNQTVHKAQPVCKLCQQVFTNELSYREHQTTHKDFPCLPCNSTYSSMHNFCQHLQDKHRRYPYICEICGIYISTLDILMKHYEGKHAGGWKKKLTITHNGRWSKMT